MPLESVTINNFENNSIDDPELKLRVKNCTDSSLRVCDRLHCCALFEKAFAKGDILYLGMFNEKPIAAMGCFNEGNESSRLLQSTSYYILPIAWTRSCTKNSSNKSPTLSAKKAIPSLYRAAAQFIVFWAMYELI
ncbi:MAG: hypothetical protein U1E91_01600 [Moraxella sp.]